MGEFTQGVCKGGACILMDGILLTVEDVLERLRRGARDGVDAGRYRKLRSRTWDRGGITVVENSSSIKLGCLCLSHERLDAALDAEASDYGE